MVLLVEKFNKFCSKTEYFPHHHKDHEDAEFLSASLTAFRSHVSNSLVEILLKTKGSSRGLSFSWIKRCLELVTVADTAFAKLVSEIDYPMSTWGANSAEEYLDHTLNLLDLLNLISSSISRLGHLKLQISHVLYSSKKSLESLKPIEIKIPDVNSRNSGTKYGSKSRRFMSMKEIVTHEALVELRNIGFWVSAVVLSALTMSSKPYTEIKNLASGFSGSLLRNLNLSDFEERFVIEEVSDLNVEITDRNITLSGDEVAARLKSIINKMEKGTEEIGEVVDEIFSRIVAGRNQLLSTIRMN